MREVTQTNAETRPRPVMSRRKSRCCCGSCFVWSIILLVAVIVLVVVLEVFYVTHVPGYYSVTQTLVSEDNVRILYKDDERPGYIGSLVSQSIWISAPNYETLPVDFTVYGGTCDSLNGNVVTTPYTLNVTQGICNKRCLLYYGYFVTHRNSWISLRHFIDQMEGGMPTSNVIVRFALFDDIFVFLSYINGNNDTIPLQQVDVNAGRDQVFTIKFSQMKKPASYYFIGIEVIGTNKNVTFDIYANISRVTYYVSNLVQESFARSLSITDHANDFSFPKQCFIVQVTPKVTVSDDSLPALINVTAEVSSIQVFIVHEIIISTCIGVLFIGCIVICCVHLCIASKLAKAANARRQLSNEDMENAENHEVTGSDDVESLEPDVPLLIGTHNDETTDVELVRLVADQDESSTLLNLQPAHGLSWYDHVIQFLKSKSAIDYSTFGRHLGISWEKLDELEKTFGHDKNVYINQILSHWRKTCLATERQESVQAIAKALEASGYRISSAIVINQFGGDTSQAITNSEDSKLLDQLLSQNPVFDRKPSYSDLCSLLVNNIAAKWDLFGVALNIPKDTMETIEMDHRMCRKCFIELLDVWRQTQSKPYTWSTVIKVLHSSSFSEYLLDEKVYEFCLKTSS